MSEASLSNFRKADGRFASGALVGDDERRCQLQEQIGRANGQRRAVELYGRDE